jgi:hypothetical protein
MGINFRCFAGRVSRQFLNIPHIGALFEEMRREAVAKAVNSALALYAGAGICINRRCRHETILFDGRKHRVMMSK